MKYDVFISYKRDGGSVWAELIRAILVHKYHLKVFLDVETVRGGEWPKQLDDGIKNSYNIIMVLFEGIGDKIKSENDIFIQEIEHAREYEKPIIPLYADGYDFSDILKNEKIPSSIKNVISIQHSVVKYDHANMEKTCDLLRKQLNTRLILKILSQHNSCSMSCQMNKGLIGESKEIKENDYSIIEIDRDFAGQIHLYFYAKELIGEFKRTINFDQTANFESLNSVYDDCYNCDLDKEELTINYSMDWQHIKKRIEMEMYKYMNPTFNPMQVIIEMCNQKHYKKSV